MINHIRIISVAILAGAAVAAQAQSIDAAPPTHWKFGLQAGTVQEHTDTEPVIQFSLGYEIDRTWSVEALLSASVLLMRSGYRLPGEREFDNAVGARVLATLPLSERWNLVGGLGVLQVQDEIGTGIWGHATDKKTGPLVSLSAMYRTSRRWSMGVEASSFTQSRSFNVGLRGEIHF
jgi:hypothetical protein